MPRKAERARRRAMNICVECPVPSFTARCPRCKKREREREKRARRAKRAQKGSSQKRIGGPKP